MFKPAKFRPLVWLLITWLPAASVRAENLVFQIGLSTTQLRAFDVNNPITYNFGVTVAGGQANLQGVQFAFFVDRQQNATAPVVFNLYNGLGGLSGTNATTGTNVSLGVTTVSATNYPTAGGNNIFASLTAPILLAAGQYSVQLTTTASGANRAYSWRPGPLQLTSTTGTNLNNFLYIEDTDVTGSAGNTLNAANPVLAQPVLSIESVPFGNFRPGAIVSQTVTLTNANLPTANNMSQALASSTTTVSANATVSGVPTTGSPLNQGFISTLPLTLTTGSAGPTAGSVVMDYLSVQGSSTATGTTAVGTGTIALSGTAWDWANAKVSSGTYAFGNVRTGSAATGQTFAVGNQAVSLANYQDLLDVTGSTSNAQVSVTGFQNLASSTNGTTTSNVSLAANTATAGSLASTVLLTYTSDANSVAGLSSGTATFVGGAPTIATTGGVYDFANAKLSAATLAFGNVRTGSTATAQPVAIGNQTITNASFQDLLDVSGSTTNGAVSVAGFSSLAASTNGTTTGTALVSANTATAGSLASSVSFTYTSNADGKVGLSNGVATIVGGTAPAITTTGGVYDYANAVYTGTNINFGLIHRGGAAASGTVAIGNQTVTDALYQDRLDVSGSTGNALVATTGFTGLGPSAGGTNRSNLVVSIGTGTAGSLASTVALSLVSDANGVAGLSNGLATTVGSPGAITTTGTVYTGLSTWNTNGSGQWGTLSSGFGANWQTFDGSPGLDAGFTDTDTATFGGVLTSGTATVTITAATPSVQSVTFANAAASYVVAGASGGSLNLLNAGTSAAGLLVSSGSHSISAPVALGSNLALDVAANSRLGLDGVLSGAKDVTKTGAGTAILAAINTYSGTTSVEAGRLLIDGSQLAATGPIFVASGATLGGRGAAGGAVTVLAGGTLSPGASIESLAVGATTFSGTSTYFYEIDSSASLSVGADLLTTSGNLSISPGALLQIADLASSPSQIPLGTKFTLVSYGANAWDGGVFSYSAGPLANNSRFVAGLNEWEIRYDDTTGGSNFPGDQLAGAFVTIQAVPEPSTWAMLAIGAVALGLRELRRRRSRMPA